MEPYEIFFGVLLVIGLVGLSLFFGRMQLVSLKRLRTFGAPLDDEGRYERRKARLRVASCALTLLLAAQITVILATHEQTLGKVNREREGVDPAAVKPTDEQRLLVRVYFSEWIAVLVVLLVVLVLAALDLWATRRFAFRQYRKITDDRRAMIQRQVNRMREQKNGET